MGARTLTSARFSAVIDRAIHDPGTEEEVNFARTWASALPCEGKNYRAAKIASGCQRPGATAAAPGGAGETMHASLDGALFQVPRRDVPKIKRPAIGQLHVEHLVEVAIVNFPAVADAQGGAAHQI